MAYQVVLESCGYALLMIQRCLAYVMNCSPRIERIDLWSRGADSACNEGQQTWPMLSAGHCVRSLRAAHLRMAATNGSEISVDQLFNSAYGIHLTSCGPQV